MDTILSLYQAFINLDYATLSNPSVMWTLYAMLFMILLLESGLLPAAFLPGDSLLFITGILISLDVLHFGLINLILIAGTSIGSWLGYLQGRWLGNTKLVKNWLSHLPQKYHQRAEYLFLKHGLAALFIGRFVAFVRTLLPILAGISSLDSRRFHIYNWLSSLLWITLITTIGYLFGLSPLFKAYEKAFMTVFMLIPVFLLAAGLLASLWLVIKKRYLARNKSK